MQMKDYIEYMCQPWKKLTTVELATVSTVSLTGVNWVINIFIPEWIGLSAPLFFIYMGMACGDTVLGIINNVWRKKQKFDKDIFFKKVFMVALALIALGTTSHLENYTKLEYMKPLFEVCRLFFYVSFIIYEFSSIRDKAVELRYRSLVNLIDIILTPLNMIKDLLKSKLNSEEQKREEEEEYDNN